jgi:hypothetical protein
VDRYRKRSIVLNNLDRYKEFFDSRGVRGIYMLRSGELKHPTEEEIERLNLYAHRWSLGDKFFKLAHKHYGDSTMWWVIAWFNKTPTEAHVEQGDLIYIPSPLDQITSYYGI